MSESENQGVLELQKDESKVQTANPTEQTSGQSQSETGGIGSGNGGVSSTAYIGSPVPNDAEQKSGAGVIETVRSYLGNLTLGGLVSDKTGSEGTASASAEQSSQSESLTEKATAAAAVTGISATKEHATDAENGDNPAPDSTASATGTPDREGAMANIEKKDTAPKGPENPKQDDSQPGGNVPKEQVKHSEAGEGEGEGEGEKRQTKSGATRENKDAIPTAGGERLGEKHWGESKIVPDIPKKENENVSSKDGQPDQATKDNTAKNVGSGGDQSGGNDGEGKEKFTDKIKDKLGMGHKE